MKTKQLLVISALAATLFTACEKNLYDPNQNQKEQTVADMVVSPDFDWKMTEKASCTIQSDHSALLSIYLDEACSESNLLATVPVRAGSQPVLPLALPTGTQKVYVQYQNSNNETAVVAAHVQDGKIAFTAPADSQIPALTRAASSSDFDQRGTTLFYPAKGEGTVMFEDNYPETGDYDFNDFVGHYQVEIETLPNSEQIKSIIFTLKVMAIGGIKPYIPHLRIQSFNATYVESFSVKEHEGDVKVVQMADDKGKLVYAFYGAEKNPTQNPNSEFLNTVNGAVTPLTNKVVLTINFKNNPDINMAYIYVDMFDIFLANSDRSQEIHMLGYGPAFSGSTNYDKEHFYKNSDNLVWGINIPTVIAHAVEKANFLNAYPRFADWATQNKNVNAWYNTSKPEFLFQWK